MPKKNMPGSAIPTAAGAKNAAAGAGASAAATGSGAAGASGASGAGGATGGAGAAACRSALIEVWDGEWFFFTTR